MIPEQVSSNTNSSESKISTEPIYVSGLSNICCLSVFFLIFI